MLDIIGIALIHNIQGICISGSDDIGSVFGSIDPSVSLLVIGIKAVKGGKKQAEGFYFLILRDSGSFLESFPQDLLCRDPLL